MSRYVHYAHLLMDPPPVGKYLDRGQPAGFVGSTGASTGDHCHIEGTKAKPLSWRGYVRGLSYWQVLTRYFNITKFYSREQNIPIAHSFPNVGYKFLQFVKQAGLRPFGGYWHPGDDANGLNDHGALIKNILPGRVVFAEGGGKYNGGWGNHFWLEVDEVKAKTLGLI